MAEPTPKRERLTLVELDRLMRDPWKTELRKLMDVMDRVSSWPWQRLTCELLFDEPLPAVDMFKEDGRIVVRIALPGTDAGEIEVSFEGDVLTIKRLATADATPTSHSDSRYSNRSGMRLRLPDTVDGHEAEAELKDGMLTVTLAPKA